MTPSPEGWLGGEPVHHGHLSHGHEQVSVSTVTHVDDVEEPTIRAGTDDLLSSSPRPGTLDEPTVDRMSQVPGHMGSGRSSSLPAAMVGQLVVISGNDIGNEYPMNGLPMSVGRALGNDIVLTDIAVSRKHMSVEFNGRQYKLIDHGSGNGTLINDRLETGTCLLHHGDRLELGNTVFRFVHPATLAAAGAGPAIDDTSDSDSEFEEDINTVVGHSKPNEIPSMDSKPAIRPRRSSAQTGDLAAASFRGVVHWPHRAAIYRCPA